MEKIIDRIRRLEENILGFTLVGVALFVFVQVILRYIFKIAPAWGEELDRYIAIMLAFMGTSLGVKYNTHFNVEAFVQFVPKKFRRYIDAFVSLFCAIFFGFVVYLTISNILKLSRFGSLTPTLRIPMYIPYIPIALFCSIASIRYILKAIVSIKSGTEKF